MRHRSNNLGITLSTPILLLVLTFCITPFFLTLLGMDFSSHSTPLPEHRTVLIDDLFYKLSGAFTHTLLEWSAFSVAIMVALLGFTNFRGSLNSTTPVICIALFCAGSMDAFHTLAANHLISAVADNNKLIPFTWAISRTFNALIIISGVALFLIKPNSNRDGSVVFVFSVSLIFMLVAFLIIHYCATSNNLPVTLFPDAILTRPWDVAPLLLYIIVCIPLLSQFHKQYPSTFSQALLLSMVPEIILELHMCFGSKALFDNDFNIAHFLKIFAYLIPGIGLLIDYIQTYTRLDQTSHLMREEKTKMQAIVDNAIDGIINFDNTGHILSMNPSAEQIFGYQEQELINKNVTVLMPESFHHEHDSHGQHSRNTGIKQIIGIGKEVSGRRKDGSTFPLELGGAEINSEHETFFTGFLRDISIRKQLENDLKSQEKLFSTLVNAAPVMMWMLDHNNRPLLFNKAWLNFSGLTLEQELNIVWQGARIHPDDRQQVIREYRQALKQHQGFDHEYRLQRNDGEYHWIHEIGAPYQENNKPSLFIGICLDIHQQKITELKLRHYTQELERSNTELEQFAFIASHDLQEPLRMVSSYTQLLERRYKDKLDDDANVFIGFAVDGANRMQTLIQDLLSLSRVGKNKQTLKSLNISQLIQHVMLSLKIIIDESNAQINYPPTFPQIMADRSQLQQLFQNLVANAIKYRAQDRQCIINIRYQTVKNMYEFSIQDNGIGIEAEFFERIFLVFQRLHSKAESSGTGIGLSICKRIVESHGGELWLESEIGTGSTFYFTLPVTPVLH